MVVMVVAAAAVAVVTMVMMVVVMVVVMAATVAVVIMVVMVVSMTLCNGCPAMFVEYHTDFIYDEDFLFFGSCFVDSFHQHIHHIVDGIDGRQGACQVLHRQFSCLDGQSIEMASCFCDEICEEFFLFCFCGRGQVFGDVEVEQFVVQVAEETFTDEFFCHQDFLCIIGEACEGTCFLQQFIFFSADGVGSLPSE